MAEQHPIERDDALLWLNDRVGRDVSIYVEIDCGDYTASVLSCESAVLRHWRRTDEQAGWARKHPRDDIAGLYYLTSPRGDEGVGLDLTDASRPLFLRKHDWPEDMQERSEAVGLGRAVTEELVLALGDDVEMRILAHEPRA
jgi:hypothetical protein